jgi:thiol-disulfide isomerase/thioredoxin
LRLGFGPSLRPHPLRGDDVSPSPPFGGSPMRRLLCAVLVALPVGLLVAADDKAERANSWKELLARYKDEEAPLAKKAGTAPDPEDRKAAADELKELNFLFADKALDLAEGEPKDDIALDATVFAVQKLSKYAITGEVMDKAVKLIGEHHLANPKLKGILGDLGKAGKAGTRLLESIADKAADDETKGVANFHLGVAALDKADGAPNAMSAKEFLTEGRKFLAVARRLAPTARIDGETIEKAAELALMIPVVGNAAPDVTGTDLDDKKVKLSSFQGKVVLLDIWATWCGPCRAMIPHERELVKKMDGKPFVLLSVSVDDAKSDLTDFLKDEPMPWAHWFDGKAGAVAKAYKVKAFPTLYLIDKKGVIREKWVGAPKAEEMDKKIEELAKEPK